MAGEAKLSEGRVQRAVINAARLADELRAEQNHAHAQLCVKKSLMAQLTDLESRLTDVEAAATKSSKAAMAMAKLELELSTKLQQKIKTYKQQIEEAEEIAGLNQAKYEDEVLAKGVARDNLLSADRHAWKDDRATS